MAFGEEIYAHLPPIPNNPRFFGVQQVMNAQDEPVSTEDRLLISALDLSFEQCAALIHQRGGLCVPAHINKGSSGVLGALGILPQGIDYDALEISQKADKPAIDLSGYRILRSSDAHYLEHIFERVFSIQTKARTVDALFDAISGK